MSNASQLSARPAKILNLREGLKLNARSRHKQVTVQVPRHPLTAANELRSKSEGKILALALS